MTSIDLILDVKVEVKVGVDVIEDEVWGCEGLLFRKREEEKRFAGDALKLGLSLNFLAFWGLKVSYLFYYRWLLDSEMNLLYGGRVHVHRDASVLPVVHDGIWDGVVAGLHGGVVAHGNGELIEVAVEEDVDGAHVDDDDLRGEGLVKVLCSFKFILFLG